MDVIIKAISAIEALMKMRKDIVWNKEQCKRLFERIDGLKPAIEKIKKEGDARQRQLVTNIVKTIEQATEFVLDFHHKKRIFKWLKRKDYKDDFQSLHEQVSQHVNDLNLGETVLIGEDV